MVRHYKEDSNRTANLIPLAPLRPNWEEIFRCGVSDANLQWFGRDTMIVVVPHSCRIGAGYKSNEQP
jgi:hypothetical protein